MPPQRNRRCGGASTAPASGVRVSTARKKNQTVVETLNAPTLVGLSVEDFIKFRKAREKYELEILEKNEEDGIDITPAAYITCIDRTLLKVLWRRSYIQRDSFPDITNEDIEDCIKRRSTRDEGDLDLAAVERCISAVHIKMDVPDAESRIDTLVWDYTKALESAGLEDFPDKFLKLSIGHIFDRIKPQILKDVMADEFDIQDKKGLRKNDFYYFVSELVKLSKIVEKTTRRTNSRDGNHGSKGSKRRIDPSIEQDAGQAPPDKRGSNIKQGPKRKSKPKCLNPNCSGYHYVVDCPITKGNKPLLDKLLSDWRAQKGKPNAKGGKINKLGSDMLVNHSTLFSAAFAETVEAVVLADNCTDENLMPPDIRALVVAADPSVKIQTLDPPIEFSLAVETRARKGVAKVICRKAVVADVERRIRHGTKLLLRAVRWVVCEQPARHVLVGRPLLEALGLDTRRILEAASDKHNGIVNVPDILPGDPPHEGTIAMLMRDSGIYHSSAEAEDNKTVDDEVLYVDLGEDSDQELVRALETTVATAHKNGMSEQGVQELRSLLFSFKDIFRITLGKSPPAKVKPMRVCLKPGARPLCAKARRYTPEQRSFLLKYIDSLIEMGFLRVNPTATWAAAPVLVPKKNSKAKFRLTVDLRAVNAATVMNVWPMPHIDSESSDFRLSTCFAVLDFVSGYWQLPLHPDSQEYHSIITPRGIVSPTRTQQGGANAVANFQARIEPLFAYLRSILKAWLDDFLLYCRSESELLDALRTFFTIC